MQERTVLRLLARLPALVVGKKHDRRLEPLRLVQVHDPHAIDGWRVDRQRVELRSRRPIHHVVEQVEAVVDRDDAEPVAPDDFHVFLQQSDGGPAPRPGLAVRRRGDEHEPRVVDHPFDGRDHWQLPHPPSPPRQRIAGSLVAIPECGFETGGHVDPAAQPPPLRRVGMQVGVAEPEHGPAQHGENRHGIVRIGKHSQAVPQIAERLGLILAERSRDVDGQSDGMERLGVEAEVPALPPDDQKIAGPAGGRQSRFCFLLRPRHREAGIDGVANEGRDLAGLPLSPHIAGIA